MYTYAYIYTQYKSCRRIIRYIFTCCLYDTWAASCSPDLMAGHRATSLGYPHRFTLRTEKIS